MTLFISTSVIILCILLLRNNVHKNKNSLYICFSLIFISLIAMLHYFNFTEPNQFCLAVLAVHIIPLGYLIGPFLYFYTRNTLIHTTKLSKTDYLHFLPFVISLISIFPYFFTDFDSKLKIAQVLLDRPHYISKINTSWLYPSYINILLRPINILLYSTYNLLMLFVFYKKNKKVLLDKKQDYIVFKWLIVINSIIVLMSIGYTNLTLNFHNTTNDLTTSEEIINSRLLLNYILSMLFCLIPILMLVFPVILYGDNKLTNKVKSKVVFNKDDHESLITTAALILDFVKKEKNLLNPNFAITDISSALNLKSKEVLYCFNVILEIKFTTLRKELRIDFAKKELSSDALLFHSMEGIWMKSGFSSRTSFFVAFKEVTGMTPLEYLKSLEI